MKRYDVYTDIYDGHVEEESREGDYCKYKDVEQLQAQTKEFAEVAVFLSAYCNENSKYIQESISKAQQYLDSLKEKK